MLNHKVIDIRLFACEFEAVIEITDSDSKQVYTEIMKMASKTKPAEKDFLPLIEIAKTRITNMSKEIPIMPVENMTMKYTPKEMLVKLTAVKDIDNATWIDVESATVVPKGVK